MFHGPGEGPCTGHHDKEEGEEDEEEYGAKKTRRNINVDAAFLHALGDMIMSIGVCVAGTIIYIWPEAKLADPVCTFLFSVLVCVTVTPIVK